MLQIRIHGYNLPGAQFGDPHVGDVKDPVYVGIQKGKATIDLQSAACKHVTFDCQVKVTEAKDGSPNFLGPYVHGKPGNRFLYLGWFVGKHDTVENRFRRTKIVLDHLTSADVDKAMKNNTPLVVEIDLTSDDGGPLCGAQTLSHTHWILP